MDMLDKLKSFSGINNFTRTNNFYYEYHNCGKTGDTVKIDLDYTLSNEKDDSILRFGICPNCGTCIYHKDYQTHSW